MNFTRLFEMQKALDAHIEHSRGLKSENLLERKILAFHVEAGELANETRCFKFWSSKAPSSRSVILEEYVDGIHFLLSIGIELGFDDEAAYAFPEPAEEKGEDLVKRFITVTEALEEVRRHKSKNAYKQLFESCTALGSALGFSGNDVEQAYLEKNEVNYERQRKGY
ncbi:dUTPase [Alteribacter lacisalsi]|jgi:dimeric dUTPase (all-alpha-NTP-PPase superfamily)|uniref:dUTPase n=1 Tax=Alteribacter lacisalsi TaxID=2045244 RepID=A0A2W0HUE5_9BACI|nr:dUTP diphosphatase [Alteribacter lacisalsi]PYZ97268.1 dUTPase [Alteribacter lacisalsi]